MYRPSGGRRGNAALNGQRDHGAAGAAAAATAEPHDAERPYLAHDAAAAAAAAATVALGGGLRRGEAVEQLLDLLLVEARAVCRPLHGLVGAVGAVDHRLDQQVAPVAELVWRRDAKEVRRRCARFLDGDWLGLYNDSSPYGATDSEAEEAELRAELQRVRREEREAASERTDEERKYDHVIKLVQQKILDLKRHL